MNVSVRRQVRTAQAQSGRLSPARLAFKRVRLQARRVAVLPLVLVLRSTSPGWPDVQRLGLAANSLPSSCHGWRFRPRRRYFDLCATWPGVIFTKALTVGGDLCASAKLRQHFPEDVRANPRHRADKCGDNLGGDCLPGCEARVLFRDLCCDGLVPAPCVLGRHLLFGSPHLLSMMSFRASRHRGVLHHHFRIGRHFSSRLGPSQAIIVAL